MPCLALPRDCVFGRQCPGPSCCARPSIYAAINSYLDERIPIDFVLRASRNVSTKWTKRPLGRGTPLDSFRLGTGY
ncbi:hypothetical protein CKAH01_03170 [Colletotrichum kahawae]|uniref:Uncharacterized protein n=1 Tax=Colletotrichum kahawae TaxID=34407 RepID=A0AAE0DBW2_COLKA|nr:hypothetical protein CKAH01_03170 [Colletotrichum kahawae]